MIAILKYNAGNVNSVENAIQRAGYATIVSDDIRILKSADKIIFPGVGQASTAMQYLQERGLDKAILSLQQPVLGICLGMQLLCKYSEEGNTKALGIFDVDVKKFPSTSIVPHTGWNNFSSVNGPLFTELDKHDNVYFVHSYYAELCENTIASCDYMLPFSAALHKDNFYGTQFHPEKSGKVGLQILQNFLKLK